MRNNIIKNIKNIADTKAGISLGFLFKKIEIIIFSIIFCMKKIIFPKIIAESIGPIIKKIKGFNEYTSAKLGSLE